MLKTTKLLVAASVMGLGFTAFAAPKAAPAMKEEKPGLTAQAKVSAETARKTALARVTGRVQSQELEEENGKLVYSFDIKAPHRAGVEEIQVDAVTGDVVSVKHEGVVDEAQERKADKKQAAHAK